MDDDDDDEGNEEGREDPNPLCSDDDVSDDEPEKLFETENVIVCQYDKVKSTNDSPGENVRECLDLSYEEQMAIQPQKWGDEH